MAVEEKKENDIKFEEENADLNIKFIEHDNEEFRSISSHNKEKDEKGKLFENSDILNNNSKEEHEKEKENEEKKNIKSKEEKKESINLIKKKSTPTSKNSSSQNRRYEPKSNNENIQEKNNDKKDEENKDNKEFINTGKFMQINPHFNIFDKQIDSLRDSIYNDTKRCLILKGSLQQSSNFLKAESNGLIKDIVEQIYNLRELFEKGNTGLNQTTSEVKESLKKLKDVQSKARKEIIECDKRITECENQIGYKLLGNPSYSFMKDKKTKTMK